MNDTAPPAAPPTAPPGKIDYADVVASPELIELKRRQRGFAFPMAVFFLAWYFGFVLLAAFCFSRGSDRVEAWLLAHPRFGPMVSDWRARRAIPMRAKQLAWVMMALGSSWSWWVMPSPWRWLPPLICLIVATWMWRLPTAEPR